MTFLVVSHPEKIPPILGPQLIGDFFCKKVIAEKLATCTCHKIFVSIWSNCFHTTHILLFDKDSLHRLHLCRYRARLSAPSGQVSVYPWSIRQCRRFHAPRDALKWWILISFILWDLPGAIAHQEVPSQPECSGDWKHILPLMLAFRMPPVFVFLNLILRMKQWFLSPSMQIGSYQELWWLGDTHLWSLVDALLGM